MNLFTFKLDNTRNISLYRQLYQFIICEIKQGNLIENEKLPSKKALCQHLKVSQSTVETAYEMLVAEGYIKSIPRSGYYICKYNAVHTIPVDDPIKLVSEFEQPAIEYLYDFKTSSVDTKHFPYATWAKLTKEIMYHSPQLLEYGHRQGDYQLRQALRKYLHEFRGVNCYPEQIVIGAGMEYLLNIILQILGSKTIYALENPCYTRTHKILENNNCPVELLSIDQHGISMKQLEESSANVAYITPSHQFPTGVTMPISRRTQLLNWASQSNKHYIIEDDYDSEFGFNGRPIPSLQGLDYNGKVIYIGTFSRSIAPSIRVSYMILPPALYQTYHTNFKFYSSTVSRFEQRTLLKFIEDGYLERHLNKMRTIYNRKKETFISCLKETFGNTMQLKGDHAGLHFLMTVYNGMSEAELISSAKQQDIKVYGLSQYYIGKTPASYSNTLVIGYAGLSLEEIPQIVKRLKQAWFSS